MAVHLTKTDLDGVLIFVPDYFYDNRGYYCETFSERSLKNAGFVPPRFVQDNQSLSLKPGIVRGIHFQINPKPQSKLVRCTRGKVFDVVVDLRKDSPTFKKWIGVELSEENQKQIWIPNWCGHGQNFAKCMPLLEAFVFLRVAIGETTRVCLAKRHFYSSVIKDTKKWLTENFPHWECNKYISFWHCLRNGIKALLIWRCKFLYSIGCFGLFVLDYKLFTSIFKKDIKW